MRRRKLPKRRFEFIRVYFGPAVGLLFWLGICVVAWSTFGQSIPERLLSHRAQKPEAQQSLPPYSEDAALTSAATPKGSDDEHDVRTLNRETVSSSSNSSGDSKPQASTPSPVARSSEKPATQSTKAGGTSPPPTKDTVKTNDSQAKATPSASAPVVRTQLTSDVQNREPVDRVEGVFHSQGEPLRRLYYFTELRGLAGETVTHNWWHKDRLVAEVEFHITSNSWRAYSSKRLIPNMSGPWKVVATDSHGKTLSVTHFTYQVP